MEGLVLTNMYFHKLNFILFLFMFHANYCQRRITEGQPLTEGKRYMVYLLKAHTVSPKPYTSWLCGGALVSRQFIVTSAACITDVVHLYAIAGYNKYIDESKLYTDPCTKTNKKKIILTCTHQDYSFEPLQQTKWTNIDIAIAKVESPYNFTDKTYEKECSYIPAAININYEAKFQEPGIDAIVMGWGHSAAYRQEFDSANMNEETLHYTPVLIQNKKECKKEYAVYNGMESIIDKYMICTSQKGNLDSDGATILKSVPTAVGCDHRKRLHGKLPLCENTGAAGDYEHLAQNSRKNIEIDANVTNSRRLNTRRGGICQNDHGGPLVSWVGAHEVLLGVATAFKLTDELQCIGPYLYTSTQCNGAFLDCILKSDPSKTNRIRRTICNNFINETGSQLLKTHISWKDHPDGPADHERNITTNVSVTNTTNNVLNLKNKTEERNGTHQVQNTTTLVTNTNYTTPTLSIENATLTITSKAYKIGESTHINLTNVKSINVTESILLTNGNSVASDNNTFSNETETDIIPTDSTTYHTNNTHASKHYIFGETDGTITTILMKTETNDSSATRTNLSSTTTVKPGNTTTTNVNVTTKVNVKTTTTTYVYMKSIPKEEVKEDTKTGYLLEHSKPTRTSTLGIN